MPTSEPRCDATEDDACGSGRATRIAPSPTGDLHAGHARSFLVTWALARTLGWRVVLRMEDFDGARASRAHEDVALRVLESLGIDWDEGPVRQSDALDAYRCAMATLADRAPLFRCALTRREITDALQAPHEDDAPRPYPRALRPDSARPTAWPPSGDERVNVRIAIDDVREMVRDELASPRERTIDVERAFGDPVVWTRDDRPAYQLAVVVDDARHQVTDVVRGDDLLPSAALQQHLARLLTPPAEDDPTVRRSPQPRWWHLPLVRDETGRRLAKRRGRPGLGAMFDAGVDPHRVIGWVLAGLAGDAVARPAAASDFLAWFDLDSLHAGVEREQAADGALVVDDGVLDWFAGDDDAPSIVRGARPDSTDHPTA